MQAILVGESLMLADDTGAQIGELLGRNGIAYVTR
jgi:hypothetical protein